MAVVKFYYRSKLETSTLKVRFSYIELEENCFVDGDSRIKVDQVYWRNYHRLKYIDSPIYREMKLEVSKKMRALKKFIIEEATKESRYTRNWLESVVKRFYEPKVKRDLFEEKIDTEDLKYWFDQYILDKGDNVSQSTVKKGRSVKKLIIRFEKAIDQSLLVKDIDVKFMLKFVEYCKAKGYAQNSTARDLVFIKTVCNYAKIFDVPVSSSLDLVKIKRERVKNIFLENFELEWIEELDYKDEILEHVKDWLLISCQTGQRVSDFMRFDKSMIRYQKNRTGVTKPLLEFSQIKTKKLMTIPLSSKVMSILDKRDGNFPKQLTPQKYNALIKQICKDAGINTRVEGSIKVKQKDGVWRNEKGIFYKWQLVCSHIGRRSFATNNYGIIPTVFLMNMTGHGSETMFLTYIGKGSNDIALQLSEYFD
ncbi:site-specific integrase [Myroides marinus]|uniref:phage integrase SAM-like domain-containing protein n=1 Tax=Myroides marinus TaxID=703342 RepID=UPI0025784B0A|nr:phage integrase SAM-like domain-containing protein [Myroides marinus]MDM1350957.1 site-specific integrase [Myroides marinus]MDM1358164.1 site-specific integrase [Myroides marinus]